MDPTPDVVLHELRGSAFWITLNREARRNALNAEVIAGIRAGLRAAHGDTAVRAIVLTGAGDKAFCAGGDLAPGGAFTTDAPRPDASFADLLRDSQRATLPIIARVNGACVAGGMGLLCMADIAVASADAKFGLPEVKVGLFPMQVMSLLQRIAPRRKVREWALTGELFGAQEALEAGLVNYVVAPAALDTKVQALVDRLAAASPTAIRRGLDAMHAIEAMSFEEAIGYTEAQIASLATTEDAREGLAAFNGKRAPKWTGK